MIVRKYKKAQAKYMINLTFTTEKQARIIEPNKPKIANAKKAP